MAAEVARSGAFTARLEGLSELGDGRERRDYPRLNDQEQQVPPLRRRWRSGSGRNDKVLFRDRKPVAENWWSAQARFWPEETGHLSSFSDSHDYDATM